MTRLLLLPWCLACAPVSLVGGHPSAPISAVTKTASAQSVSAQLVSVNERGGSFGFSVTLSPAGPARVVRAVLTHQSSEIDRCDAKTEACDELDSRFSHGVSAAVLSSAPHFVLVFPSFGTRQALAEQTRLLLDVELEQRHYLLELDLSRERAFRMSDWGIGGALRYRPQGLLSEHFGQELSGELGVDRWFSATRVRLSYEIGFAGCRGSEAERANCQGKDLVLPFGFGLNATQFLRLDPQVTLGVSLGYEGVAVFGRFRSENDKTLRADPFLHGPRLALLLMRTPRAVPRFVSEAPKNSAGLELSLELLGRGNFEQPVLLPGVGYSYTFGF